MEETIQSQVGDSGGPVMVDNENGEFTLLGIYNGVSLGSSVVTRWDNIEKEFNVKLY